MKVGGSDDGLKKKAFVDRKTRSANCDSSRGCNVSTNINICMKFDTAAPSRVLLNVF